MAGAGTNPAAAHFERKRPGWLTKNLFNPIFAALTRAGLGMWGACVLEVRGRKSGEARRTPVNLLTFERERYLVAPRGETQWVRNLRAAGEGRLHKGRHSESFTATELSDEQKPPLLRAYLKRWSFEVASFFDGVGAEASEEDLRREGAKHPVFHVHTAAP